MIDDIAGYMSIMDPILPYLKMADLAAFLISSATANIASATTAAYKKYGTFYLDLNTFTLKITTGNI